MPEKQFQTIGDQLTKALISGDFAQYAALMELPMRITPRDGKAYALHDMAALRQDFDLYHAIIKTHGVTDIYRQILSFDRQADNKMLFTCITHILVRAHRIVEPFQTRMTLHQRADGWRISEIESSEGHINWTLGKGGISATGRFEGGK